MDLYTLMKNKDMQGVLSFIHKELRKKYSEEDIISQGELLFSSWMRKAIALVEKPYEDVLNCDDPVGIIYKEDNMEYSSYYEYYQKIKFRVPKGFMVTTAGIFTDDGDMVTDKPLLLSATLIIDNGRFNPQYRFKLINNDSHFVASISEIKKIATKKHKDTIVNYITYASHYNSWKPERINIINF